MKFIKKISVLLLIVGIFFSNTGNIIVINANTTDELSEESIVNEEPDVVESTENIEDNIEEEITDEVTINQQEETLVELDEVTDAINSQEQELLLEFVSLQNNKSSRSLMSEENLETKDFLLDEQKEEAFIVILEENLSTQQKLESITGVFEKSDGKRIDAAVDTVIITKDSDKSDVEFTTEIENISNVQLVEKARTFTVELDAVPNDPYYSASSNNQWELKQMQMEAVWDIAKGAGVKIGVYDVGFAQAYGYPTEFNRLQPLVNYAPNGDKSCYTGHTHGTTVISIAGGVATNNGVGMASIAHQATFQPYLSGYGCSPNSNSFAMSNSDFTKVYTHAINNGVDILNMSFGDSVYSESVDLATQRAYDQGLFIVASRGNSGNTVANYPACSTGALAVGALTQNDLKASFSSYGDCGRGNYIMAYGQSVSVTVNNSVSTTNGTSFAAPIVAGVLGLMKSVNLNATNNQLLQALKDTAKDLGTVGFDQTYGYGKIQPLEAVKKIHAKVIVVDRVTYYLDDRLYLVSAKEMNNGIVSKYYEYYTGTKYATGKGSHIKYIYNMNPDGSIKYTEERLNNNGIVSKYYEYYTGTKYATGKGSHIKYIYNMNPDGSIRYTEERLNNSGIVSKYYEYYTGTKYATGKGSHIKYIYNMNPDGSIRYTEERLNNSGIVSKYYEYYTGTKYATGKGSHIKYIYNMNPDGSIKYTEERLNNSGIVSKYYEYYTGTKYATGKGSHIKYIYNMNPDGSIKYTEERLNNSGVISKYYEYYTGTKYATGKGSHIKYIYFINKNKTIDYAIRRNDNQTKNVEKLEFLPNTFYGKGHQERISNRYPI